jgi:hypothetical protein
MCAAGYQGESCVCAEGQDRVWPDGCRALPLCAQGGLC